MFNFTLTNEEVQLLGALLGEHPYKQVAPLLAKLNQQMIEQQQKPQEDKAAA
jgi:hypothetical protein